jgi:hypothetical protein
VASQLVAGHINARRCNRNAEKVNILNEENEILRAELERTCQQYNYLCDVLTAHEVPVTEFDMIVINSLI